MLRTLLFTAFVLLLTGCAVGPNYEIPQLESFKNWEKENQNDSKLTPRKLHNWWENFKDPVLNSFIKKAKESNLDVKSAYLNIKNSRLTLNIEEDKFDPNISAGLESTRAKNSENGASQPVGTISNNYQAGLNMSWEIELFGKVERKISRCRLAHKGCAKCGTQHSNFPRTRPNVFNVDRPDCFVSRRCWHC